MAYNGWKNYATCTVANTITQTSVTDALWKDEARTAWTESKLAAKRPDASETRAEYARRVLAETMKDSVAIERDRLIDRIRPNDPSVDAGVLVSLLCAGFERVDWHEIANWLLCNTIEEYETEVRQNGVTVPSL